MKYSRPFLTAIIALLFSLASYSQSLIGVAGITVSNAEYSFDFSVGEINVPTMENTSNGESWVFSSSLLQPTVKMVEPGCEVINDLLDYYPNPTRNMLNLNPKYDWITGYRLYKANGNLVQANALFNNQINMSTLAPGIYFLQLLPGCNSKHRILKVVKQ
jgi:hypothetical protein